DDRAVADVRADNEQLRVRVSELTAKLEALQRINADRQLVGVARDLCTPAKVVGTDPSEQRQALNLRIGSFEGVREGQAVLYRHGLVGRIDHAGAGGSQVQLVTDRDFRVAAEFRRYVPLPDHKFLYQPVGKSKPFLRGAGRGMMTIQNIELKETADAVPDPVKVGDLVVVADPDFDQAAGQWLGAVEKI